MSILVKATAAPAARTETSRQISLLYAAILVVFVVAQLFTFDEFIELVVAFNLPLGLPFAHALAPTLIVAELFAVPFLLRMSVSPAFRYLSMFFGWLVVAIWLFISWWVAATFPSVPTIGFFGTVIDVTPGWWAVLLSLALGILAAWSSWGLWPGKRRVTTKK